MTTPASILVIDDDPNNFDVIQVLLNKEDYIFHYASSGQRALDRVDRFQPDVILLDVMMPDLDGIEVCRRIKALPRWQSVPIVMVTALTDKKELERCLSTGAEDLIAKPVNRLELIARVALMLRIKRQYDGLQIAQQKLELAAQAQDELLAMITDEMTAPITDVLEIARLLATTELTPIQHEHLQTVRVNGEKLLTAITNILDSSRCDLVPYY
ncbi:MULTISPECIES: response regulator [unclassified Chamaesiphon]|uniref:response regulator n=1 Tax=unclassified Chamaesiphon TaxID=2620921 RepID=UPI00286A50F0|nr:MULTISPECIES: response regulator [unclassified Chamaesiphon]